MLARFEPELLPRRSFRLGAITFEFVRAGLILSTIEGQKRRAQVPSRPTERNMQGIKKKKKDVVLLLHAYFYRPFFYAPLLTSILVILRSSVAVGGASSHC